MHDEPFGQAALGVHLQVVVLVGGVGHAALVVGRDEVRLVVAVDKVGKACPLARRSVPDVSLGICVKLACVGGNRVVVVVNRHVGFKKF